MDKCIGTTDMIPVNHCFEVDALSLIVHRDRSQQRGRVLCERLKDLIPRQQFKVVIQAVIGGKSLLEKQWRLLEKMLPKNFMEVMLLEK